MTQPGQKRRVLIVDDSSFMRMAIRSILSKEPNLEVVGTAADGIEGLEKAISLKPDIITMDIEMPRMDGITALRQIMAKAPTRVLMVSTLTSEGAKATFDALEAGAIDYIPKNVTDSADAQTAFKEELLKKIAAAFSPFTSRNASITASRPAAIPSTPPPSVRRVSAKFEGARISCVGIGASTGGPVALQEVISRIPANFPYGIMVAIHMPKAFTGPYADRLNAKCSITVREAKDGDLLSPGTVLIAPGGSHCKLVKRGGGYAVQTAPTTDYPKYVYIPSVDLMIQTLAEASGGAMLGVILTGMGSDGFLGMKYLKERGGITIAQDEATSTIYGMPKACVDGKVADAVLPLTEIGPEIARIGGKN